MSRYPIETAPCDGTEIIGWDAAGSPALIAWCDDPASVESECECPETEPNWYRRAEGNWDLFDGFALQMFKPVMWMPLPKEEGKERINTNLVNFAEYIKKAAGGEEIEAVLIGPKGMNDSDKDYPISEPISWDDAVKLLDYQFDKGLGGDECHPVYVWTHSWVIAINEYDGAHDIVRLPRHLMRSRVKFASVSFNEEYCGNYDLD